jgi:hypothetical protein
MMPAERITRHAADNKISDTEIDPRRHQASGGGRFPGGLPTTHAARRESAFARKASIAPRISNEKKCANYYIAAKPARPFFHRFGSTPEMFTLVDPEAITEYAILLIDDPPESRDPAQHFGPC